MNHYLFIMLYLYTESLNHKFNQKILCAKFIDNILQLMPKKRNSKPCYLSILYVLSFSFFSTYPTTSLCI